MVVSIQLLALGKPASRKKSRSKAEGLRKSSQSAVERKKSRRKKVNGDFYYHFGVKAARQQRSACRSAVVKAARRSDNKVAPFWQAVIRCAKLTLLIFTSIIFITWRFGWLLKAAGIHGRCQYLANVVAFSLGGMLYTFLKNKRIRP